MRRTKKEVVTVYICYPTWQNICHASGAQVKDAWGNAAKRKVYNTRKFKVERWKLLAQISKPNRIIQNEDYITIVKEDGGYMKGMKEQIPLETGMLSFFESLYFNTVLQPA